MKLTVLGGSVDSLSQVDDALIDELTVDGCPYQELFLRSDVIADSIFHVGSIPLREIYRRRPAGSLPSFNVGPSLNPYLPHYQKRSLSPASLTLWIIPFSLRSTYSCHRPCLRIHRAYRVSYI